MNVNFSQISSTNFVFKKGGVFNRWEYVVAGPPISQIAIAEPLALPGETVISPQAWEYVRDLVIGTPLEKLVGKDRKKKIEPEHYNYQRIEGLEIPPILPNPIERVRFQQRHMNLLRR